MKDGMGWIWLALAIGSEIMATSALKAAAGFTRPLPSIAVIFGYAVAFYALSQTLRTIPMGIAYALWSGVGIVVISLIGLVVYRQKLDAAALAGIAMIVAGTLVINLFSTSSAEG
nr:multidrug efflux SMR transporter [Novosphingobium nitrogenifigens]